MTKGVIPAGKSTGSHLATAEFVVKFTSTTNGRDKILRLIQYLSRWGVYMASNQSQLKEASTSMQNAASTLAMTRKLLRAGKQVDFLMAFYKASNIRIEFIRYCKMIQSLAMTSFVTFDFILWLNASGVKKFKNVSYHTKAMMKSWLCALLFGVLAQLYKLYMNYLSEAHVRRCIHAKGEADELLSKELQKVQSEKKAISLELMRNTLDIIIPSSKLGYIQASEGVVGLAGALTSLIGIHQQSETCSK